MSSRSKQGKVTPNKGQPRPARLIASAETWSRHVVLSIDKDYFFPKSFSISKTLYPSSVVFFFRVDKFVKVTKLVY
ncbi:hypothetical protein BD408DRAFT_419892 [Parasitella parasitica]|nr:hypothetical protein BD408DRAFT_419892 [Parasitella parasitica]